jgi:hypothetical protein
MQKYIWEQKKHISNRRSKKNSSRQNYRNIMKVYEIKILVKI